MPSGGTGVIDLDLAREIAATVPHSVDTFLLTSSESGDAIADEAAYCGTTTVQIVRHVDPDEYSRIIKRIPNIKRVQVIHIEGEDAVALAKSYEPFVDVLLLDSGRPSSPEMTLGGTGDVHDWSISATIVNRSARPVFLAGGLTPDNVREAIRVVSPFGVDLCSGLRTNNRLDEDKLRAFMKAVAQA